MSVYIPWTAQPGEYDTPYTNCQLGGVILKQQLQPQQRSFIEGLDDLANAPRGARWSSVVYSDGNLYKIGGDNAGATDLGGYL